MKYELGQKVLLRVTVAGIYLMPDGTRQYQLRRNTDDDSTIQSNDYLFVPEHTADLIPEKDEYGNDRS